MGKLSGTAQWDPGFYLSEISVKIICQEGRKMEPLKLELYLRVLSIVRMSAWYKKRAERNIGWFEWVTRSWGGEWGQCKGEGRKREREQYNFLPAPLICHSSSCDNGQTRRWLHQRLFPRNPSLTPILKSSQTQLPAVRWATCSLCSWFKVTVCFLIFAVVIVTAAECSVIVNIHQY